MKKYPDYILTAEDLSVGYPQKKTENRGILHDLNFSLRRGELTCLLGANGIGKSTLLRTLSSAQAPIQGRILIQGKDLNDFSAKELSQTISIVLTDKMQVGGLRVAELVAVGRQPHTGFWGRLSTEDKNEIEKALQQVGMIEKADCYMAELSDGERQKAMIAKALAQECPLIILDEPTAFLDAANRIEIMSLLQRITVEEQKTILLSTHDIEQALNLADRLWLLSENKITVGIPEDLVLNGEMDHLFSNHDLRFDRQQGCYHAIEKAVDTIYLQCHDDTLIHWLTNAFHRKGYACQTIESEKGILSGPLVIASSIHELLLKKENTQIHGQSIEDILDAL